MGPSLPDKPALCKGLFPDPDCMLARQGISTILESSSVTQRRWFWTALIVGTLVVNLTLYLFRTLFILACVEDSETTKPDGKTSTAPPDEHEINEAETSLQDRIFLERSHHDLDSYSALERTTLYLHKLRTTLRQFIRSTAGILRLCFVHDPAEQHMATRNLSTTLKHLRYNAGSSTLLFRALPPYLLWVVALQRIAVFAISLVIIIAGLLLSALGMWLYGLIYGTNKDAPPGGRSTPALWPALCIARVIASGLISQVLAFHTLRILSAHTHRARTTLVSNIFASYNIWRHPPRPDQVLPVVALPVQIIYASCSVVADLVPYLMTKDLVLDYGFYFPDATRRQQQYIARSPNVLARLAKAYLVWWGLNAALVLPAAWWLFRRQAQAIALKEPTVVAFKREDEKSGEDEGRIWFPWSFFQFRHSVNHKTLLRIIRIVLQMTFVGGMVFAAICGIMWWTVRTLPDGDLILEWLLREYLDFGLLVSFGGYTRNMFFWFLPNRI